MIHVSVSVLGGWSTKMTKPSHRNRPLFNQCANVPLSQSSWSRSCPSVLSNVVSSPHPGSDFAMKETPPPAPTQSLHRAHLPRKPAWLNACRRSGHRHSPSRKAEIKQKQVLKAEAPGQTDHRRPFNQSCWPLCINGRSFRTSSQVRTTSVPFFSHRLFDFV